MLRFTGMVLNHAVEKLGTPSDFVGHIGGDDFIVVSDAENVGALREEIIKQFTEDVGTHYDFMTRMQGYLVVKDDEDNAKQTPLMSLMVGTLRSADGPFTDIREITEAAAETRRRGTR